MPNKYGVKCPSCNSTAVWKYGTIPSRRGLLQRFKCTVPGCARTFYKGQPGSIDSKRSRKKS